MPSLVLYSSFVVPVVVVFFFVCLFLDEKVAKNVWPNKPFYSCLLSYLAMNASEAGGDLVLIQTFLFFSCKSQLVSIRTT